MDTFINLAKQGMESYSGSHSEAHKTGGHEYNSPHHSGQDGSQADAGIDYDHHEVVKNAEHHGSGDSSLFSNALDFVNQNKHSHSEPVDEEHVQEAHRAAYQENSSSSLSAGSMGSAAALQIVKKFTSGGGGGSGSSSDLISLAMAEASKLFDKSGGASSGNKQDAVNSAGMTVMKLMVQSKLSGMTGGSNSGGLGSVFSLANKFM